MRADTDHSIRVQLSTPNSTNVLRRPGTSRLGSLTGLDRRSRINREEYVFAANPGSHITAGGGGRYGILDIRPSFAIAHRYSQNPARKDVGASGSGRPPVAPR